MTGGSAGGKKLNIVGIGCGDETPALALKETRRLMVQLGGEVMIGPLSGDESVAIANWAKQNPQKTVIIGTAGVAGPDDADRAEEPLPLPRRRRPVERGPRGDRLQEARLAHGRADRRRLQLPVDLRRRHHRRLLRHRRQDHEARVDAAEHGGDYAPFIRQLPAPDKVDGYFWLVGGANTSAALTAFEQAYGPLEREAALGQPVPRTSWVRTRRSLRASSGAYFGGFGTFQTGGLKTKQASQYVKNATSGSRVRT